MNLLLEQWKCNTQILKKSCAQVETSVIPKGVIPKSCGLKPKNKRRPPVPVRYSESQLEILETKARKAGLCRSEYIRTTSLGEDYKPLANPDLTHALLLLNRELTRQGNNLNQIAKHHNSHTITQAQGESMLDILGRSMLRTHKAVRKALAHGEPEPEP